MPTINLWEAPAAEALQAGSLALLAWLPFLAGGEEVSLLEPALEVVRAPAHGPDLEAFRRYVVRQVGGDEALRRLGARVDMAALRKTAWFQDIVEDSREEGRRQGIDEGQRRAIR